MYSRDSALLTVHGIGDQQVLICVGEKKGPGEHFGDGRGVSTLPVRIEPEFVGRKDKPLTKISCIYLHDILARGSG